MDFLVKYFIVTLLRIFKMSELVSFFKGKISKIVENKKCLSLKLSLSKQNHSKLKGYSIHKTY